MVSVLFYFVRKDDHNISSLPLEKHHPHKI